MPPVSHSTYILKFYLSLMNDRDAESRKAIRKRENEGVSKTKKMEVDKDDLSPSRKKGLRILPHKRELPK